MYIKNFLTFLKESDDKINNMLSKLRDDEKINVNAYYMKKGSPVFIQALYALLGKKGQLYMLNDDDTNGLHFVLQYNNMFYDIMGESQSLKDKEEYVTIVGQPKWLKVDLNYVENINESKNEVLALVKKMQQLYKGS